MAAAAATTFTFTWTHYNRILLRREHLIMMDLERNEEAREEYHSILQQIDDEFLKLRDDSDAERSRAGHAEVSASAARASGGAGGVSRAGGTSTTLDHQQHRVRGRSSTLSDLNALPSTTGTATETGSQSRTPPPTRRRNRTVSMAASPTHSRRRLRTFSWIGKRKPGPKVKFGPVETLNVPSSDLDDTPGSPDTAPYVSPCASTPPSTISPSPPWKLLYLHPWVAVMWR
jgi:hypothetical protein